jgi:hypothetical protein
MFRMCGPRSEVKWDGCRGTVERTDVDQSQSDVLGFSCGCDVDAYWRRQVPGTVSLQPPVGHDHRVVQLRRG